MCSSGSAEPRQGEEDITEPVPCLASCRQNPKMVRWEGMLAAGSVLVSQAAGSWFFLQAGGCFYITLCSLEASSNRLCCFFRRACLICAHKGWLSDGPRKTGLVLIVILILSSKLSCLFKFPKHHLSCPPSTRQPQYRRLWYLCLFPGVLSAQSFQLTFLVAEY